MYRITKIGIGCLLVVYGVIGVAYGEEAKDVNKNVTIITGQMSADGKSTISKELLEECIASLPDGATLEPQIDSKVIYLKGINGDANKNDYVKTYSAFLEINYMVRQKELIIITTNTVQKQEPVTKIVDKEVRESKRFDSDPSATGDLYAGKSNKEYYFTSAEAAKKDVLKRASAWLTQQQNVVCKGKR